MAVERPAGYDPGKKYSAGELRSDFDVLVTTLREAHADLHAYVSDVEFNRRVREIRAALNRGMTEIEFYRLLAPLVASIRCGHTWIKPSHSFSEYLDRQGELLPLDVAVGDGKLIVRHDLSARPSIPAGAEIDEINGVAAAEVLSRILDVMSGDGLIATRKRRELQRHFARYYAIFMGSLAEHGIAYRLPGRKRVRVVRLESISADRLKARMREKIPPPDRDEGPVHFSINEEISTAILRMKTFDTRRLARSGIGYQEYFRDVFCKMEGKSVRNLVVDVRGNPGGSLSLGEELLSYFADRVFRFVEQYRLSPAAGLTYRDCIDPDPFVTFKPLLTTEGEGHRTYPFFGPLWPSRPKARCRFSGKVYVLIDGETFSAASLWAARVHAMKRAVFVGEESGGTHAGSGISPVYGKLPNTGLRIGVAFGYVSLDTGFVPGNGRGVMPDHVVARSAEGTDPGADRVMEYVLNRVRKTR